MYPNIPDSEGADEALNCAEWSALNPDDTLDCLAVGVGTPVDGAPRCPFSVGPDAMWELRDAEVTAGTVAFAVLSEPTLRAWKTITLSPKSSSSETLAVSGGMVESRCNEMSKGASSLARYESLILSTLVLLVHFTNMKDSRDASFSGRGISCHSTATRKAVGLVVRCSRSSDATPIAWW